MQQVCWNVWPDRGLLINPDPVASLIPFNLPVSTEALEDIENVALGLPDLLENRQIRTRLEKLPVYDVRAMAQLPAEQFHLIERLQQMYAYFASSYVYATHEEAATRLPAGVAVPLVELSKLVERPPILAYTNYVLNNWRLRDPNGGIVLDNLELNQNFLGNKDEAWFILVHVDIEARAAVAMTGLEAAAAATDPDTLQSALEKVAAGLTEMIRTFHRMVEGCDSDVYYFKVRPYIFGFNNIAYEGVEEFGGVMQNYRGQTGAQSSIIPAMVAGLGLRHEQNGLMQHLEIMKAYMPKPHRELIGRMRHSKVRAMVEQHSNRPGLVEVYNLCLQQMLEFRRLHYHFATIYIFQKVENPLGTGGTVFMEWLHQLIDETEGQLVKVTT